MACCETASRQIYLARTKQLTARQFSDIACYMSDLLGISETCSNRRSLLAHDKWDAWAAALPKFGADPCTPLEGLELSMNLIG